MLAGSPDITILFTHAEISALLCYLSNIPNLPTILLDLLSKLEATVVLAQFPSPSHNQLVNLCY